MKDLPRIILLTILYAFQGLPIGLFLSTVPILFKKYLTYAEIGVIMMCTLPFSLKVLWSPFVDVYYFPSFGKRKSWIVPTQLLMSLILYYLSSNIEPMLEHKEVYTLTVIFNFFIFVITCQDIAVDSWAVEILHAENASYASTCQSVGQRIGMFISTSMFIALHSVEFCNNYVYTLPGDEPVLTLKTFMMVWSNVQLAVTLYIMVFVSEASPHQSVKQEEKSEEYGLKQVFMILGDVAKNRNIQTYFVFRCLLIGTMVINYNLGSVYLTNDLKFPAEKLSVIQVALAPVEILSSFISGYLSSAKPFRYCYTFYLICATISTYTILILFGFFAVTESGETSYSTIAHVIVLSIISTISSSCLDTANFSVIFQICDKRVSGVYITLLATVSNLSMYVHKLYIFQLVEYIGLFWSQGILTGIAVVGAIWMRKRVLELDELPKEAWNVSDSILKKVKQQ
ncbi:hypothetical protein FGO68_gene12155 [Halteria grandinella]|uniref:Acetyl-coenzyme A transporter 1 n=1 Tax=Halteria grandinella TaxID=5974 RepID=A0A8J8NZL8_HALGN|nr:hypothetical protein FGO68_gene12155 [Halteria grandinella]